MAQLPPKVPSTTSPIWPADNILHQKDPSWSDEFLDFSTTRSGSHRRSMSDSMAFLDSRMVEECRRPSPPINNNNAGDFDRFDDEQLISSMFTDDMEMGPTLSCSSSLSDHNSINDDEKLGAFDQLQLRLKGEVEEEQSSMCLSKGQNGQLTTTSDDCSEKIFDPKRIKRVLANRQSAQRSRVRKLHYVSELEQSVTSLQAEVSVLSPRVAYLDHQRLVLNVDNSMLKQRIAALTQDKLFKDAHQEALKKEIERLRQIYYQQSQNKIDNSTARGAENYCSAEKEQLAVN